MKQVLIASMGTLLLFGCATFNPQDGDAFADWKQSAARSGKGSPQLVGMKENVSVYYLNGMTDHNVFYWFKDGQLYQVTQGQLPQVRYQIEVLQR